MREFGGFGCRFLFDDISQCGRRQRPGSSYCPMHHRLCHLQLGSRAEAARLSEDQAYVEFVERREEALRRLRATLPNNAER
jgi:hypothetical protein